MLWSAQSSHKENVKEREKLPPRGRKRSLGYTISDVRPNKKLTRTPPYYKYYINIASFQTKVK